MQQSTAQDYNSLLQNSSKLQFFNFNDIRQAFPITPPTLQLSSHITYSPPIMVIIMEGNNFVGGGTILGKTETTYQTLLLTQYYYIEKRLSNVWEKVVELYIIWIYFLDLACFAPPPQLYENKWPPGARAFFLHSNVLYNNIYFVTGAHKKTGGGGGGGGIE